MATKLKGKAPQDSVLSKPKALISGGPGVGKSWLCSDFRDNYYMDIEGGAKQPHYIKKLQDSGALYFGVEDGALDFAEVIEQTNALATTKHDRRTLVYDSITKLMNVEVANEQARLAREGKKDEFGLSKKTAASKMRQLVNAASRCPMTVLFVCHSKSEWGLVGGERQEIGVTFDGWEKLAYELDLWIHIEKVGPQRSFRVKKSRIAAFEEGKLYECTYDTFAEMYGRETLEGAVVPIALATPAQVSEIKRLFDLMKISDEDQIKGLSKYKAETPEELSEAHAVIVLDKLNEKIAGKAA